MPGKFRKEKEYGSPAIKAPAKKAPEKLSPAALKLSEKAAVKLSEGMASTMTYFYKNFPTKSVSKGTKRAAAKTGRFVIDGVGHNFYMASPYVIWYKKGSKMYMYIRKGKNFSLKEITSGQPLSASGKFIYRYDVRKRGSGDVIKFNEVTKKIIAYIDIMRADMERVKKRRDLAESVAKSLTK